VKSCSEINTGVQEAGPIGYLKFALVLDGGSGLEDLSGYWLFFRLELAR
jgi:hypothetical protein